MNYKMDKKDAVPVYLQLYKQIRDDIVEGIYDYNSRLPSKRTLAEECGVSMITVEHAYLLLCDEGYVESRERSGYFVSFRKNDGFQTSERVGFKPIESAATNVVSQEAFPFSVLTKTMRRVMTDYGERILERSPNAGCVELRSAISRYLARSRGIHVGAKQIVIGSGSEYLYSLIIELLGRGKRYALESPSYHKIEQVYQAAEVAYEMLPLGQDGILSEQLWKSKADVLHITPYRSFPSGVIASATKRYEYLKWAGEGERYIIEDDFESEFSVSTKPEDTLVSYDLHDNVIYMNTFSKTISPSLRVGYMVLPVKLVPEFEKRLGFYSCTVATFIQYVLTALIENGDFERHINRVRRKKRKELS